MPPVKVIRTTFVKNIVSTRNEGMRWKRRIERELENRKQLLHPLQMGELLELLVKISHVAKGI